MDASLHAHFSGTGVPGFGGPVADLPQREGIRVGIGAALGERAEPAAGVADVGEVDVAGDHVGDVVPVDLAAQPVGDPGQFLQIRAVGGEQGDGLVVGEGGRVPFGLPERGGDLAAGQDRGSAGGSRSPVGPVGAWHLVGVRGLSAGGARGGGRGGVAASFGDLLPVAVDLGEIRPAVMGTAGGVDGYVQVGAAGIAPAAVRLLPRQAARHGAVGGQAGRRVGQRGHVPGQPRVQPGLAEVRRVDGEPLAQREARARGAGGELVDGRPRALGVDVVRGQRGDTAPVVDAGPQDQVVLRADQVGRGLDAGLGPENEPGHGDRGGQVVEFGVRGVTHLGVRLGPEVLHDDFLDAAVLPGDLADGEDRLGALGQGLADADEDARGERDVAAAGVLQDAQPHRRVLVRAAEVRGALVREQAAGRRLEHHAHGRGDRLEPLEVLPAQHAGVQVREQAGLLQHADRHGPHVGQRVVVAVRVQPLLRLVPAVFRPVAQGEQGFLAAERGALAGDVQDLVRFQVQVLQAVRDGGERAVAAAVPAQPGQRDEDLARVRDDLGRPAASRPASLVRPA